MGRKGVRREGSLKGEPGQVGAAQGRLEFMMGAVPDFCDFPVLSPRAE